MRVNSLLWSVVVVVVVVVVQKVNVVHVERLNSEGCQYLLFFDVLRIFLRVGTQLENQLNT